MIMLRYIKELRTMIAFIRGTLVDITETHVFVDVQGVGYQIECANPYVFQQEMNKEVFIYTYHHVREDSQTLYGFKTEDEKQLFEKLISVSGIGPKSGLNIQGTVQVNDYLIHLDRNSTRLNSSHVAISYAVFCLKE